MVCMISRDASFSLRESAYNTLMPKSQLSVYELFAQQRDIHQTPMYANVMRAIGWTIEGKPGSQIFVRKLGPIAVSKMQRPEKVNLSSIESVRKKYRTITFQLEPALHSIVEKKKFIFPLHIEHNEPEDWISSWKGFGFARTVMPLAHSASSLIDLRLTKQQLLEHFSQKTRYNIRKGEKGPTLHVEVIPLNALNSTQRKTFLDLRAEWSKRKNVMGYDQTFMNGVLDAFKNHGACLFAVNELGETLATLLILTTNKTAIYFSAFSSKVGYTNNAPTLLTWSAMNWAKEIGMQIFDFGGVYDPRYRGTYKRWKGFTEFKERFKPTFFLYPKSFMKTFWW